VYEFAGVKHFSSNNDFDLWYDRNKAALKAESKRQRERERYRLTKITQQAENEYK
jgi:hypothetical protein